MADVQLIRLYLDGKISDSELANSFYPYIKKIASQTARKLMFDPDDLAQELWGLFSTKIIQSYDFNLNLDAFVYEFARRHCLYLKGMNREISFTEFHGNIDSDSDDDGSDGGSWIQNESAQSFELDEEGIHSKIKGEKLMGKTLLDIKLLKKLPCISDELLKSDGTIEDMVKTMIRSGVADKLEAEFVLAAAKELQKFRSTGLDELKPVKGSVVLSEDQKELRAIRLEMGRTKPQFAKDIGIEVSSLDAYEYGRTKSVPQSVMEEARTLAANFTDDLRTAKAKFSNLPMSEIVGLWANSANISLDDPDRLAVLLGTTRTTIRRWLSNESRAEISKIAVLNLSVNAFVSSYVAEVQ